RSPDARLPRELRRGAPGDRARLPLPVRPVAASLATGDTLQSRVARCTLPQAKCASSATSLRLDRERIGVEVERELLAELLELFEIERSRPGTGRLGHRREVLAHVVDHGAAAAVRDAVAVRA